MSIHVKRFPRNSTRIYDEIRHTIRSGDILMCSGNAWFSKLIQHASDSIWSHVAVVMRFDEVDRIMVMESVEPAGVRGVPLRKYLTDYDGKGNAYNGGIILARHKRFSEVVHDDQRLKTFGQFAVDLFGYPYDKNEIAKIAARISAQKLNFTGKEQRELKRDKEYICSEYVWECFNAVGIKVPHDKKGFISPADFARIDDMELQYVLQKQP